MTCSIALVMPTPRVVAVRKATPRAAATARPRRLQLDTDPAVMLLNAIVARGIALKELAAELRVSVADLRDYRAGRKRMYLWLRLRLSVLEKERALGLTDLVEALSEHWLAEIRRRGRNAFPDADDPYRATTARMAKFEREVRNSGPLAKRAASTT